MYSWFRRPVVLKSLAALFLVALLLPALPAGATPPTPGDSFTYDSICSFPVRLDTTAQNVHLKPLSHPSGQAPVLLAGGMSFATLTNLSTGYSIQLNASGPAQLTNTASGSILSYLGAGLNPPPWADLTHLTTPVPLFLNYGQTDYYFSGQWLDGYVTNIVTTGQTINMCDALNH